MVGGGGEGVGVGERGGVRGGGGGRCHALGGGMVSRGCRAGVAEGGGRGKARGALGDRDRGGERGGKMKRAFSSLPRGPFSSLFWGRKRMGKRWKKKQE